MWACAPLQASLDKHEAFGGASVPRLGAGGVCRHRRGAQHIRGSQDQGSWMLGHQIPAPLNMSTEKCFKMNRFGYRHSRWVPGRSGAGPGVPTPLPFLVLLEQQGELGRRVSAFNLNGFEFCGFVSPFMLIK